MTEEAEVQRVLHALHSEGWAEFVCCGEQYLIQCENNKGWDYVSLWCTGTGALCLERVLFDGPWAWTRRPWTSC